MGGRCLTAIGGGASIAGLKGPAHDEVQTAAGCLRWPRRSLFHWHGWPQWREAWVYRGLYGCRIYRIPENLGLATTSCLHNIAATGPTFVMVPQNSGIRGLLPSCDARPPGGVPVPAGGFAGPSRRPRKACISPTFPHIIGSAQYRIIPRRLRTGGHRRTLASIFVQLLLQCSIILHPLVSKQGKFL